MKPCIYAVTPTFVAEIGDVDLGSPLDGEQLRSITDALTKYAVLVFPDQRLSANQHVEFAKTFGQLEIPKQLTRRRDGGVLRIREDLSDISNLDHANRPFGVDTAQRLDRLANLLWHSDSSFRHVPAYVSLLYCQSIAPLGGHTEFADMRAAWDRLPDAMKKRLDGLVVEHAYANSRAKVGFGGFSATEEAALPSVQQVLVRSLPDSGRKSLYLSSHAGRILGLDEPQSCALLEELTQHATNREFVYTHRWRVNDLVMWDNRCTMHRGTEFDDVRWNRDMQRATVSDIANTLEIG